MQGICSSHLLKFQADILNDDEHSIAIRAAEQGFKIAGQAVSLSLPDREWTD
jgi:hypothetical protein